jgi:hypothetical protein
MLSVKKVARAIKSGRGRYHDGFGLNLVVKTANNASWQLRYQIAGRERWLGLGPAHLVTIGEARVRARRARLQLLDNLDPIEEKRKLRAATALSQARAIFRWCRYPRRRDFRAQDRRTFRARRESCCATFVCATSIDGRRSSREPPR